MYIAGSVHLYLSYIAVQFEVVHIVHVVHICVVCQVKCPGHYSNMVHGEGRITVMKEEERRRYMQAGGEGRREEGGR